MSRPYYLKFKVCNTCKNILHISKFNKNKKCKYGVGTRCKECYRLYYNENKDWNLLSFYKETFGQWLQKYGIQINNICTNEMSNPNSNNKMRISDLLF